MLNICVIIPSSCTKKVYPYLEKAVQSLISSAAKANIKLEIVIVSNFKNNYLGKLRNKINLRISNPGPFNFALMNNIAIEKALVKYNPDYVFFLNDDAYVSVNFFNIVKKDISKHKFNLLIPLLYKDQSHKKIDSFGIEYFRSGYSRTSDELEIKTTLASCSCLLIETKFLVKIKKMYGFYFNEVLESYYDDIDLSIRARGIKGKIIKDKHLIAYHVESVTSGFRSKFVFYKSYRNVFWVILMCWPLKSIFLNMWSIIVVQSWFLLHGLFRFGPKFTFSIASETLINLKKLIANRKKIQLAYSKNFPFENLLNRHTFKTGKGVVI